MSFHPGIASSFNETKTRSRSLSPQSGMCAFCDADCPGSCEIGLSAVLGAQSVYPTTTGNNQIASITRWITPTSTSTGAFSARRASRPRRTRRPFSTSGLSARWGGGIRSKSPCPCFCPPCSR